MIAEFLLNYNKMWQNQSIKFMKYFKKFTAEIILGGGSDI